MNEIIKGSGKKDEETTIGAGLDAETVKKLAEIAKQNGPMVKYRLDPESPGFDPNYQDELDQSRENLEKLSEKKKK